MTVRVPERDDISSHADLPGYYFLGDTVSFQLDTRASYKIVTTCATFLPVGNSRKSAARYCVSKWNNPSSAITISHSGIAISVRRAGFHPFMTPFCHWRLGEIPEGVANQTTSRPSSSSAGSRRAGSSYGGGGGQHGG